MTCIDPTPVYWSSEVDTCLDRYVMQPIYDGVWRQLFINNIGLEDPKILVCPIPSFRTSSSDSMGQLPGIFGGLLWGTTVSCLSQTWTPHGTVGPPSFFLVGVNSFT